MQLWSLRVYIDISAVANAVWRQGFNSQKEGLEVLLQKSFGKQGAALYHFRHPTPKILSEIHPPLNKM